jgi:hypothetical protein
MEFRVLKNSEFNADYNGLPFGCQRRSRSVLTDRGDGAIFLPSMPTRSVFRNLGRGVF